MRLSYGRLAFALLPLLRLERLSAKRHDSVRVLSRLAPAVGSDSVAFAC